MTMKRLIIFTIILISGTFHSYCQVGINTESPTQPLHINGGSTGTTDDVVVTSAGTVGVGTDSPDAALKLDVRGNASVSGNVRVGENKTVGGNLSVSKIGIGTENPATPVHIAAGSEPALRLADGTQGDGYLLTSDTGGNAFWGALRPMSSRIEGRIDSVRVNNESDPLITSQSLTLAPGKWLIFARVVTAGSNMSGLYMYLYLREGTTMVNKVGAYCETNSPYKTVNQLMYLAEVPYTQPGGRQYSLHLSTSSTATGLSVAPRFGNYFYAVRLDR